MKIILINDSMKMGGTQTYLLKLGEALYKRGHEVTIVANEGEFDSKIPPHISYHNLMIEGKNPFLLRRAIEPLTQLLQDGKYDIIHTNTVVAAILVRFIIKYRKLRVPIVSTAHKVWEKEPAWYMRALAPLIYNLLVMTANAVISLNSISYDRFKRLRPRRAHVEMIYNGIELNHTITGAEQSETNRTADWPILFTGRLVRQKRIDLLLHSLGQLSKDIDFRCGIVGDGPLRRKLENLANSLDLNEKVHFLGFRADVSELLQNSRIFVLASKSEGISFSMLEALQHGLPIVGFDCPGVRDVVEHGVNGLLVPFGDTVAFAHAMQSILTDDMLYAKLKQGSQSILRERYLLDTMVEKTIEVYHKAQTSQNA